MPAATSGSTTMFRKLFVATLFVISFAGATTSYITAAAAAYDISWGGADGDEGMGGK